jgi:hypothetical protein
MTTHPQRAIVGTLTAVGLLIACSNGPGWNTSADSSAPVAAMEAGGGSGDDSIAPSGSSGSNDSGSTADGGRSGSSGSSSGTTVFIPGGDGGPCQTCSSDSDCKTSCASMKIMTGYNWCCQSSICIMWQGSCPMVASGSSSSGGGGPCGAAMQPCCSNDPQCQMNLSCQSDGTCG